MVYRINIDRAIILGRWTYAVAVYVYNGVMLQGLVYLKSEIKSVVLNRLHSDVTKNYYIINKNYR